MSATAALKAARAAGVQLGIDGGDLLLKAVAPPPAAVLDLLSRHKAEIVALLSPGPDGWSAEDWQGYYQERAGIAEFEAGLDRAEAEARAFACCVAEWLNRRPERSAPGRCIAGGRGENGHEPLVPYGGAATGHAWLHSRCWPAWYAGQQAEAVAALAAMAIVAPAGFPDDFGKNGGV